MITVLAGGTGSVKLVRGLYSQHKDMVVISNVADNFWFHGLYVCPDIDTMIYGLSNKLDKKKGWGIEKDTFNFLNYMKILGEESWFGLGDKDLAMHVLRTKMLKEGKKISEITSYFAKKYDIPIRIIPASDDHYETRIVTEDRKEMHLQEFWIKHKASVPISDIFYHGIEKAQLTESIIEVLDNSKVIIFAPGNPITSIGSIVNIPTLSKILKSLREKVIMISPFVSNKVISGPSEIYMLAKKLSPSIKGLIDFYSEFTTRMIFSNVDKREIEMEIADKYSHVNFYFTDIIMNNAMREKSFAKYLISNFINP